MMVVDEPTGTTKINEICLYEHNSGVCCVDKATGLDSSLEQKCKMIVMSRVLGHS